MAHSAPIRPPARLLGPLLCLMPLTAAAMERYDFSAYYDVLSHAGDKIGTYINSVNGPEEGVYTLRGSIELKFSRAFKLFHKTYSSSDEVLYDEAGVSRYEIVENNQGQHRRITGVRNQDQTQLDLAIRQPMVSTSTRTIPHSAYDYILYDFRFPITCAKQADLTPRELRILTPANGRIDTIYSESAPLDGRHTSTYGKAQCRLLARNAAGDIIKDSWFLEDGTLLFEKTHDYQLILTRIEHGERE